MPEQNSSDTRQIIAEAVRAACAQAALDGYRRAGMDGLCAEGTWENA